MFIFSRLGSVIRKAASFYDSVLIQPFRKTIYRRYIEEEELFMMICFSELLGLPCPITYYTLELYPAYAPRFHDWHKRMGMEHSPLDEIKCC